MQYDNSPAKPAPSRRRTQAEIIKQRNFLARHFDDRIIDTIPNIVLLLNAERQIVHANQALLELLGAARLDDVLGLRPGEVFRCVNADTGPDGCGTSEACAHCGALQAMIGSLSGQTVNREGRILVRKKQGLQAMNVQVRTVPLEIEGSRFTIIYLQDIAERKIRELMDSIFLHDALNTLGGLAGAADLLHDETQGDVRDLAGMVLERARYLEREIKAQRMLRAAENETLDVQLEAVAPATVCQHLATLFRHGGFNNTNVVCDPGPETPPLSTDPRLLYRVLENLIKNALEASPKGAPVHVGYTPTPEGISFTVTNQGAMPAAVQAQLFQRAFSTKGRGRGLGTYSAKMLTENHLGGRVTFTSDENSGTTFTVTIPNNPPHTPQTP